jgi:NADH-quinone oxidoreductase subunit M
VEDVNGREFLMMAILAIAVLALGLWPAPLLEVMKPTIDNLLQHIMTSKL